MDLSAANGERIAELEAALAAERQLLAAERVQVAQLTQERDRLRSSHEALRIELELLKRRLFVAKAERIDTEQLELEFAATLAALDKLAGMSPLPHEESEDDKKATKIKPKGRRDIRKLALEEERIEISDPLFEKLVAEGKAEQIGYEESCKLGFKRGGFRRVVVARVKYQATDNQGESCVETALMPPELLPRSLAAPSLLAHIVADKCCDGLPLFAIEDRFARMGVPLDRGMMSRWLEEIGGAVGPTILAAAKKDALATAFCISTDATGISVQPTPRPDKKRQACRRGHYFVLLADKDHVFFEYTPHETSAFVAEMLEGYEGYIQADAKSVYDILFRKPGEKDAVGDDLDRTEVGCWGHCRRGFWEATVAKSAVAREGLARIGRIFALEEAWRGDTPETILRLRQAHLRPHLEEFFRWVAEEYPKVQDQRGLLRSAFGYATRQRAALMTVLEDGRLVLDNNASERALRKIAIGRKRWLFVGSDLHAQSTANLFSLIASARLHAHEPEEYLRDIIRVLPHWPKDRYLELSPKYWAATRVRIDPAELAAEVGYLTVPSTTP